MSIVKDNGGNETKSTSAQPSGTWKAWFLKYFWEGQLSDQETTKHAPDTPFYVKYSKFLGALIPALIVHLVWWPMMATNGWFYKFTEKGDGSDGERYLLSITMWFGSVIAGATSEGGASVAFPVMTLTLGVVPAVARDFSFMIQSIGMTAAAFAILWMKVKIEWHSIGWTTLGGIGGVIFGLEEVAPRLEPAQSKMYFVVIWFAFAFSLYWLNRLHTRRVFDEIPDWNDGVLWSLPSSTDSIPLNVNWKAVTLFAFGFLGGIFSAMGGSGIDICSFSCLTLLFRVNEKVATPTSVVLMGINTVVGFLYRQYGQGGVEDDAWAYLLVCAPIVVLGAPFGSVIGSHFHRLTLSAVIYATDTVQLIGALYHVKPWLHKNDGGKTEDPTDLCVVSVVMLVSGAIFFKILGRLGLTLMQQAVEKEEARNRANKKGDIELNVVVEKVGDGPLSIAGADEERTDNSGAGSPPAVVELESVAVSA